MAAVTLTERDCKRFEVLVLNAIAEGLRLGSRSARLYKFVVTWDDWEAEIYARIITANENGFYRGRVPRAVVCEVLENKAWADALANKTRRDAIAGSAKLARDDLWRGVTVQS